MRCISVPIDMKTRCPPKSRLRERPLLAAAASSRLARLFKVLSNDTRLRLLHALARAGELCPTELARTVGMKPQAVSNQLVRLSDTGMLSHRREGNNVYYRVKNGCVAPLLDLALCLMEDEGKA